MAATQRTEQSVLQDLISKWISLGIEYLSDSSGVSKIYIYAASERPGVTYVGIAFDEGGSVKFPEQLSTYDPRWGNKVEQMLDLLSDDLFEARAHFDEIGAPPPTEYRVYYEIATRKLDVQLSREIIYGGSEYTPGFDGFKLWLGDRAPKL
ncbi:hypothetical protein ACF044_05545 [Microbacterium sp. NPDC016588]